MDGAVWTKRGRLRRACPEKLSRLRDRDRHHFSFPQKYERDIEISEAILDTLPTDQDRFNLVIGHYLAVHISTGRSAELLGMSTPELMVRLGRSGIALRVGPESQEELHNEVKIIEKSLRRK